MAWYHPGETYDTVYAVSDLHGDVDVLLTLFTATLKVVRDGPHGWEWVTPDRVCIVVCGDVVDRSRGNNQGGASYGENVRQKDMPDDLYMLRLLNLWADLAAAATPPGAVLRVLGNHEVFSATLRGFASQQSVQLLSDAVECHVGVRDVHENRVASFTTPYGAYFQSIWYQPCVRLVVQIGGVLFLHAGLTPRTMNYMQETGHTPNDMLDTVQAYVLGETSELPPAVADILQDRTLTDNTPQTASRTRYILRRWNALFPDHETAHTLVVGHCTQFPETIAHDVRVHGSRLSLSSDDPQVFSNPLVPWNTGLPLINCSCDASGSPMLWRIDTGQSRAWRTADSTLAEGPIHPQALQLHPRYGAVCTLMSSDAIP
jgi:hypothetical protein